MGNNGKPTQFAYTSRGSVDIVGWTTWDDMIFLKGGINVPTLETKRLQLIPFSLDLKKAAMNDRARLVAMLGVYVPEHWPGLDLAEALPVFVENMEKAPSEPVWDWIVIHRLDQGVIGGIGFMGGPDKDGVVEVGYDIVP